MGYTGVHYDVEEQEQPVWYCYVVKLSLGVKTMDTISQIFSPLVSLLGIVSDFERFPDFFK